MVQKFLSRAGTRKHFWTPNRGVWGHAPSENFENYVLRLAENAFPTFKTHQFLVKMLRNSSNRGKWCCLTRKLFEFTAHLEILVMYHEDRRIKCILQVSRLAGMFILKLLG